MPKWTDMQAKALAAAGNLLISASAGSGKTSVMVQKIEDYLLSHDGADISRLVAITFTKASAEEMKQKLADNLYKRLRDAADDSLRARIRRQINGIPLSNISTIDSYCSYIYLRYFETINKDPAVSIIEPGEAAFMFASAREEVLESYLQSSDEDFAMLVDKFTANRDIDRLRKAIDDIHRFLAVQSDPEDFVERALSLVKEDASGSATTNYILSYHRKKAGRLAAQCQQKFFTLSQFVCGNKVFISHKDTILDIRDALQDIANAKDIANLFFLAEQAHTFKPSPLSVNTKVDGMQREALLDAKAVIESANEFIKEIQERFSNGYDAAIAAEADSRKAANKLFEVASAVIAGYRNAKDKEKLLDFADLEHYALQILSSDAVAAEVKSSIDRIYIDEYQDTNYLQESILNKISDGNMFMVGDVKQSIYKFRYAEPAIFLDKRERYIPGKDGTNIDFNENFRSSQAVLSFINLIFDEIMVYDLGEIDYRKDARLKYGLEKQIEKKNTLPDAEITLFNNSASPVQEYPQYYSVLKGPRCLPQISGEAIYIADRITQIVGKMLIYDAKQESHRLCRYQDIALLFRARSNASDIIAQLQKQNIPFIAEGFDETSDSSTVDTLICFAKVLDNPKQDIPLAAVMLSYFGRFCDNELLEIRANYKEGYFWEAVAAYSGNPTIETKLKDLFALIEDYRSLSAFIGVRELFDRLIAATGYDGYALSLGSSHIQRLNAFIHSLSGKESSAAIKSFLDAYAAAPQEELPPSGADDCVTLTTIHKSKGMEYPIVFLPSIEYVKSDWGSGKIVQEDDTGTKIKKEKSISGSGMVALDAKLGISIVHIDGEGRKHATLSSIALSLKKDLDNKAELIRLLYVAVTRARQHLFISGISKAKTKRHSSIDQPKSFLELINYALDNNPSLKDYFAPPPAVTFYITSRANDIYIPKEAAPIDISVRYPFAAAAGLSCKYSVSTLARQAAEASEAPIARHLDFDSPASADNASADNASADNASVNNAVGSGSSNKAQLGTAYHAIMQHADFSKNTPAEVDAQIDRLLADGIIDPLPQGFNRYVMHRAFANPRLASLSAAKIYREQPFMLHVPANMVTETASTDTVLVQGVIDFLSVGSLTVLVDYKYTFADADTIRSRYRKQLDIYRLAAQYSLGVKVDSCEVFVINRNEFIVL